MRSHNIVSNLICTTSGRGFPARFGWDACGSICVGSKEGEVHSCSESPARRGPGVPQSTKQNRIETMPGKEISSYHGTALGSNSSSSGCGEVTSWQIGSGRAGEGKSGSLVPRGGTESNRVHQGDADAGEAKAPAAETKEETTSSAHTTQGQEEQAQAVTKPTGLSHAVCESGERPPHRRSGAHEDADAYDG